MRITGVNRAEKDRQQSITITEPTAAMTSWRDQHLTLLGMVNSRKEDTAGTEQRQ
jgi:hypothetical protein